MRPPMRPVPMMATRYFALIRSSLPLRLCQVARDPLTWHDLSPHRHLHIAESAPGNGATCMKRAAGGRVRRARRVADEDDPFAVSLDLGVGYRHRREQRARVGVHG